MATERDEVGDGGSVLLEPPTPYMILCYSLNYFPSVHALTKAGLASGDLDPNLVEGKTTDGLASVSRIHGLAYVQTKTAFYFSGLLPLASKSIAPRSLILEIHWST